MSVGNPWRAEHWQRTGPAARDDRQPHAQPAHALVMRKAGEPVDNGKPDPDTPAERRPRDWGAERERDYFRLLGILGMLRDDRGQPLFDDICDLDEVERKLKRACNWSGGMNQGREDAREIARLMAHIAELEARLDPTTNMFGVAVESVERKPGNGTVIKRNQIDATKLFSSDHRWAPTPDMTRDLRVFAPSFALPACKLKLWPPDREPDTSVRLGIDEAMCGHPLCAVVTSADINKPLWVKPTTNIITDIHRCADHPPPGYAKRAKS